MSKADNNRENNADVKQQKYELPKFDLADDIMAEQRKITAIRRKAPSQKGDASSQEQQVKSIEYAVEQPTLVSSGQQQIIVEIVARDIKNLIK